ncbi:MAG: bifunctional proline dehydrogenase/L-glutamate gamma-semialdehyde dehydrogenase PutA, partial [Gammaproteobacteria bacterium]|nr:bifunctional proline dehydrogenase/L-glutamate gamma-semialdehyde dehydrogenase PutA [Gammaproteobacteria bacterium]
MSSANSNPRSFVFSPDAPEFNSSMVQMSAYYHKKETEVVNEMMALAKLPDSARQRVQARARLLVDAVRKNQSKKSGIEAFLQQYDLSSEEGIILMCLAEALLRIPDSHTADKLIRDKLSEANWDQYLGTSDSWFVNASTWGLMLTGKVIKPDPKSFEDPGSLLGRMVSRTGEPVIRTAIKQAMKIMGHQFVMGRTIQEALERSGKKENRAYRYSFDMLGEAALTASDAKRYLEAYVGAIEIIGAHTQDDNSDPDHIFSIDSISVKLSALHPRYEFASRARNLQELVPNVLMLAEKAKAAGIALTIDAEEADRLELSLEVIERVYRSPKLQGWQGFGLAVQGYQKRALRQLEWLQQLVQEVGRKMPVRLVKGAYWDTEIKRAQEEGLPDFPVYTRKASTDVAYLACARFLLNARDQFYPQFATHNAHTLASVIEMSGGDKRFEFQRLHGMGDELYAEVIDKDKLDFPCRVYAPVGSHEDLLPYLVRRLLENGANTSFVNRIMDENVSIDDIIECPLAAIEEVAASPHPYIKLPLNLFKTNSQSGRDNSSGMCASDQVELQKLQSELLKLDQKEWTAGPVIDGKQ